MTIPFERTRALVETKRFLEELLDPKKTPKVPKAMRYQARALLRHYPSHFELEIAHKAAPAWYGPVQPDFPFQETADTAKATRAIVGAAGK